MMREELAGEGSTPLELWGAPSRFYGPAGRAEPAPRAYRFGGPERGPKGNSLERGRASVLGTTEHFGKARGRATENQFFQVSGSSRAVATPPVRRNTFSRLRGACRLRESGGRQGTRIGGGALFSDYCRKVLTSPPGVVYTADKCSSRQ